MLLRTIAVIFALGCTPVFALDAQRVPQANESQPAGTVVEPGAPSLDETASSSDDSPAATYGLALATLALVGFMSRR